MFPNSSVTLYCRREGKMAFVNYGIPLLTSEQKETIANTLKAKGVRLPCPRCGYAHFSLLDGIFNQPLTPGDAYTNSYMNMNDPFPPLQGAGVPSVVTACSRCGFLSQHALGSLGLLLDRGSSGLR